MKYDNWFNLYSCYRAVEFLNLHEPLVFTNNLYVSLAHFFCWYLAIIVNDVVIAAAAAAVLAMCQAPCQCFLYFIYASYFAYETNTVNNTHFTVGESGF